MTVKERRKLESELSWSSTITLGEILVQIQTLISMIQEMKFDSQTIAIAQNISLMFEEVRKQNYELEKLRLKETRLHEASQQAQKLPTEAIKTK